MLRHSLVLFCAALFLTPASAAQTTKPSDDYVWATTCKDCHAPQYSAWEQTKHAHTLNRLAVDERAPGGCIRCHVTGATALVPNETNANVQCEACHGPGRRHMQGDPEAITQKPDEKVCVACHSEKSPHFKYFSYSALAPLAHKIAK